MRAKYHLGHPQTFLADGGPAQLARGAIRLGILGAKGSILFTLRHAVSARGYGEGAVPGGVATCVIRRSLACQMTGTQACSRSPSFT